MGLHIKHKALIGGLFGLSILFGGLFVLSLVKINKINSEVEIGAEIESNYLKKEEAVIVPGPLIISSQDDDISTDTIDQIKQEILPIKPVLFEYIQVLDSCGYHYEGECLNARSGPGTDFPIVSRLRSGIVLKIGGEVVRDGQTWYKVVFDEWIRYPERVKSDLYIAADYVRILLDEGVKNITDKESKPTENSEKRIVVSRSNQTLKAYEGDELLMELSISTGIELTPTPKGTFTIFRKTPSRYMQGPLPGISTKYWDLPGVPWNLYFTRGGAVIHGAYWHNNFGSPSSNGCVNVRSNEMEELYKWAELGTKVIVTD